MSALRLRRLRPGVYTAGRLSIERTPAGRWTVYLHAADAADVLRAALRGELLAPELGPSERVGNRRTLSEARALARLVNDHEPR